MLLKVTHRQDILIGLEFKGENIPSGWYEVAGGDNTSGAALWDDSAHAVWGCVVPQHLVGAPGGRWRLCRRLLLVQQVDRSSLHQIDTDTHMHTVLHVCTHVCFLRCLYKTRWNILQGRTGRDS